MNYMQLMHLNLLAIWQQSVVYKYFSTESMELLCEIIGDA